MPTVDRSAFLYMDPTGNPKTFAQCGTCLLWNGPEWKTCFIHSDRLKVGRDDTCGLYVHGRIQGADAHTFRAVTPKESGFERRLVRCEHCVFFKADKSRCGLFERLNRYDPETFTLDPAVHKYGCCNANTPRR